MGCGGTTSRAHPVIGRTLEFPFIIGDGGSSSRGGTAGIEGDGEGNRSGGGVGGEGSLGKEIVSSQGLYLKAPTKYQ